MLDISGAICHENVNLQTDRTGMDFKRNKSSPH